MALEPKARAAGSSLSLRFTGNLVDDAASNLLVYPQKNGALPANLVSATKTGIRFLFADAVTPTPATQFPSFAFDDTQPAGAAPHAPWTGALANLLSATDQIIGKPNDSQSRTWAANLDITINALTPSGAASAAVAHVDQYVVVLDGTTSGLGLNSGLPVLIVPMTITHNDITTAVVALDMIVTINHSKIR